MNSSHRLQLNVGERFRGKVREMSLYGTGVVDHPSGMTVFVEGGWTGDSGEFEISEVRKRFAHAKISTLDEPSSDRVTPLCSYQSQCGGCSWMMVSIDAQLAEKERLVAHEMKRAGIRIREILPILKSENVFAYRNRAQLKTDGEKLGFLAPRSHELVDIEKCAVLVDSLNETVGKLREKLPNSNWKPRGRQGWVEIVVDDQMEFEKIAVGRERVFRQGNSFQNTQMRTWLAEQVRSLSDTGFVTELFCGNGNFTEVLSERGFERILAIDGSSFAIDELRSKALPGVSPLCENLYDGQGWQKMQRDLISWKETEILVVDPPRDGLKLRKEIVDSFPKLQNIFYISCGLSSLVNDLAYFQERGFTVDLVQPLDLFPQTPHVENLVVLKR